MNPPGKAGNAHVMTDHDDDVKTPHAPGSQPSTRPDSDEPQTITAPTPPVAWTTGPPKEGDVTDEEHPPKHAGKHAGTGDDDAATGD
jgi:hypothetical protein